MYDEQLYANTSVDIDSSIGQNSYFAYLDEISEYKLLSIDEEVSLFQKIQNGDDVAKDLFIKSNLRLVVAQAKKFYLPGCIQLLDLIQEGNLGLMKAIELFDPTIGVKFSTYAVYHINKAIQRTLNSMGHSVKLPAQKVALLNNIRSTIEEYEKEEGRVPTYQELAKHLNVSIQNIMDVTPFIGFSISFNSKIYDDTSEREFIDVFSEYYDVGTSEIESEYIINETREEFRRIITEALTEKAAYILCSRWGLFDGEIKKVSELARELKMSQQGIRQSEANSIIKLKKYLLLQNRSLSDFL